MTGQPGPEDPGATRQQDFPADGPVELDLGIAVGRIEVTLADQTGLHVDVRHDPAAAPPWTQGINTLLGWVADQFGGPGFGAPGRGPWTAGAAPADAVRQVRIDFSGRRLVVRTPKAPPLRQVPLAVTVTAPTGSHLDVRNAAAALTVTGSAGRVSVHGGSGDIRVDRATGAATVTSGSGAIQLGPMPGGLHARASSGDIDVSSIGDENAPATASLGTGSGDMWLGAVWADISARTGSGDITVADAAAGDIDVFTGSGDIRIAVRPGIAARIDLSSGSGRARSELEVSDTPPEGDTALRIRGRTGSGNAVVTSAVS